MQQAGPRRPHFCPNPWNDSSCFNGEKDVHGINNLSKSFRPNLATIRVLSLGTKFIPKCDQHNCKRTFAVFNDFISKMNNRAFVVEERPGLFVHCKVFRVKNYFVLPVEHKVMNSFCWNLRDDIDNFIDSSFSSGLNLSNKEKEAFKKLMMEKNKSICIDDMDKNLEAATADKVTPLKSVVASCMISLHT